MSHMLNYATRILGDPHLMTSMFDTGILYISSSCFVIDEQHTFQALFLKYYQYFNIEGYPT